MRVEELGQIAKDCTGAHHVVGALRGVCGMNDMWLNAQGHIARSSRINRSLADGQASGFLGKTS